MNVLVVGSGGREHALAWKISQSSRVKDVFVTPGNAGTALDAVNVDLESDDYSAMVRYAKANDVGLTVVGPEVPLANGIVDIFESEGLKIFGPAKPAAQLEASKVFCKQILNAGNVPTADYWEFHDADSAIEMIDERFPGEAPNTACPLVVKADGLAAGKGVTVCSKKHEVLEAIELIARDKVFGDAGTKFILEEKLDGQEASILAITDGQTIIPLPACQDHKPAYDGDAGPNTGGMGAYCPAPLVTEEDMSWVEESVLVPTVHALKANGTPFKGVLYAGLMKGTQGIKVLEYNVRFGDPECQPLLLRLKSDLVDVLEAVADGDLARIDPLEWDSRPSCCVVMASEGYPGSYEKGRVIHGLNDAANVENVKVFHAGTTIGKSGAILNNGGRVLGVTAIGDDLKAARLAAYEATKCIQWQGSWYRTDIANKAL
ncbi:MAG: phosphoribosylamine--glycine ligase [Planctomycetota bacterium]|nr:phosphoribosylamine--glycine ligase [Planctomycetota bacterium]